MELGKWSLLDIETTGINSETDEIIDLGYLSFDGTKLVKKYSSLVWTDKQITPFITHLTGITADMVKNAPKLEKVEESLYELQDHICIAHNAAFESSFLEYTLEDLDINFKQSPMRRSFIDSMFYLILLHPGRSRFNLESFIIDYNIADVEIHRGYEDSRDLLKVLLAATFKVKKDKVLNNVIEKKISEIPNFWFKNFYHLSFEQLKEIASQIEFDLESVQEKNQILVNSPRKKNIKFSGEEISNVFQDEESVQETLPGYKHREQQEQMALKIGQSFSNGIHSMVQAPTGTGKTLGYLVPSLLFAKDKNKKVLISTGTKLLQSQLIEKDLNVAQSILGSNSKVTKLIGTQNHYCRAKFEHSKGPQGDLFSSQNFEEKFLEAFYEIMFHSNASRSYEEMITAEDRPGILSRMMDGFQDYEKELKLDFKTCIGAKCPYIKDCSYFIGHDEAKKADVIIGNHALTFLWPSSIDRPEYIIFDEAHKIEETATDAFSIVLDLNRLANFFKTSDGVSSNIGALFYLIEFTEKNVDIPKLKKDFQNIFNEVRNHLSGLKLIIEKIVKETSRYTDEYWNEVAFRKEGNSLEVSLANELASLGAYIEAMHTLVKPHIDDFEDRNFEDMHAITAWSYVKALGVQIEEFWSTLGTFLGDDPEYCRSIFYHNDYGIELKAIPINIGATVHEKVIENTNSVVFTSATLGSMDGKKGHLNAEWLTGYHFCESQKRFKSGLFLDPVFDYKNNAKVFLTSDHPPIYQNEYVESILEKVIPILKKLKGRSLLLFSSYKRFELAREILLMKLGNELEVFFQGKNKKIIEDFKKSKHAVLVGLESFGEGIDIPGESLSFVYIDKIPDQHRSLVVESRKQFFDQNLGNSFSEYFMATRARKLTQKLGRLIRTPNDKGVILITDPRVGRWKSRTIKQFCEYLSPYQIQSTTLDEATKAIRESIE